MPADGFSEKSLRHMVRFAEASEDETIVSTLPGQLSWSHFLDLISIDEPLKRISFTGIIPLRETH